MLSCSFSPYMGVGKRSLDLLREHFTLFNFWLKWKHCCATNIQVRERDGGITGEDQGLGMIWHHLMEWWISGLEDRNLRSGWLKETGSSGRDRFGKPQSKWQAELGDANGGWEVWSATVHGSLWKMFCQTCLISFFGKKQVWQIGYMILVASY